MNVYDFDKTIYDGDSTVDFYKYCLKRNPRLLKYLFRQAGGFLRYTFGRCNKTEFKERFYSFLNGIDQTDEYLCDFWDIHIGKIKPWYKEKMKSDDVIVTASPEFLIKPVMERLGSAAVIASLVDVSTGKYTGLNCYGQEKVSRFYTDYPDAVIEEFYSD